MPLRFRYQTFEFGSRDVHLRSLRDTQQYSDPGGKALDLGISPANWALFGVVWDSSQVLARLMADFDIDGKRILELGCGMALSSLLLNRRGADITATDYHPEAGTFLESNTLLNQDSNIPFFRADWSQHGSTEGLFDLIIASDVLYENFNLSSLARFVEDHAQPTCDVVIVDPGRKQQGAFSKLMSAYTFTYDREEVRDFPGLKKPFNGSILRFCRR